MCTGHACMCYLAPDHVGPLRGCVQPRSTTAPPLGTTGRRRSGSGAVDLLDEGVGEHGRGDDDVGAGHQATQIAGLQFRIWG